MTSSSDYQNQEAYTAGEVATKRRGGKEMWFLLPSCRNGSRDVLPSKVA